MADFSMDQLLMAFDIDLTPMKSKAADADKIIDELEAKWSKSSSSMASAGQSVAASQQETSAAVSEVVSQTQQAVTASREQTVAAKETTAEVRQQILQAQARKAALSAETAEITKQTAELRKQRLETATSGSAGEGKSKGEGGGSGVMGVAGAGIKDVTKGIFGEGLASEVAAGAIAGEGIGAALALINEGLTKFVEMMKDAVEESSELAQVKARFTALAEGAGSEMPSAMDKMRDATRGLIPDIDLARAGIAAWQTGLHLSADQVSKFTGAVVNMALHMGRDPVQALKAAEQAMATGRAASLAYELGVSRASLSLEGIGMSARGAAGAMTQTAHMMSAVEQMSAKAGPAQLTLANSMQVLKVATESMFEEFAAGFQGSAGIKQVGTVLTDIAAKFHDLSDEVKPFGLAFGESFGAAADGLKSIFGALGDVVSLFSKLSGFSEISKLFHITGPDGQAVSGWRLFGTIIVALAGNIDMMARALKDSLDVALAVTDANMQRMAATFKLVTDDLIAVDSAIDTMTGRSAKLKAMEADVKSFGGEVKNLSQRFQDWQDHMITSIIPLDAIITWFENLVPKIRAANDEVGEFIKKFSGFEYVAGLLKSILSGKSISDAISTMDKQLANSGNSYQKSMTDANQKVVAAVKAGAKDMSNAVSENMNRIKTTLSGSVEDKATPDTVAPPKQLPNTGLMEELAKAKEKMEEALAKAALERQLADNQAERDANELSYKQGLESLEDYIAQKRALQAKDSAASLAQINLDERAQLSEAKEAFAAKMQQRSVLESQISAVSTSKDGDAKSRSNQITDLSSQLSQYSGADEMLADQLKAITAEADAKRYALTKSDGTKLADLQAQLDAATMAAARKTADGLLKLTTDRIDKQQAAEKAQFEQGRVSPADYQTSQQNAAVQTAQAQGQHAQSVLAASPQTPASLAAYNDSIAQAAQSLQEKVTQIYSSATTEQLQFIQNVFDRQEKAIDVQLAFIKQYGYQFTTGSDAAALLQAGIAAASKELQAYEATFQQLNSNPDTQFDAQWQEVVDKTQQAFDKLQQYKLSLAETVNIATPLGSIWDSLGKGLSTLFANAGPQTYSMATANAGGANRGAESFRTVSNPRAQFADIGESLSAGGGMLSSLAATNEKIKNLTHPQQLDPVMQQMHDLTLSSSTSIKTAADAFGGSTGTLTTNFQSLSDVVTKLVGQFNDFLGGKPASTTASTSTPSMSGLGVHDVIPGTSIPSTGTTGLTPYIAAPEGRAVPGSSAPFSASPLGMPSSAEIMAGGDEGASLDTTDSTTNSMIAEKPMPSFANSGAVPSMGGTAADSTAKFASGLGIAVSTLTSFVGAITSAKSAISGAFAGGAGGAAIGSQASSALGGSTGNAASAAMGISGSLSAAMPAIGAGLGVIMGVFMGEKNAMVQTELTDLKNTYTQMQEAYSSGNATLQQTISQLETLIAEAQADMANSKKGSSQFQSLITQYNQQLQQYEDQAQTLMIQLNQQVKQLVLPNEGVDYTSYISSLQQIVQQYEAFAGAASTAAQSLQAQQYLQESLASQVQQWSQQMQQDEINAVQSALQLNQLTLQYQQLLQNTAQTERGILEQGVLTRQQTFAQSKAQQLAQTQYQAGLQEDQMEQQILLTQAQVSAASQVFDLATTRVGLESQLLTLQESAATRSEQSVQALANLLQAMGANGQGVVSNNSATPTANNFITQLLALLAGNSNASSSTIMGLLAQYEQYTSSGLGVNGSTL